MSEPRTDQQDPRWGALTAWRRQLIDNGEETSSSLKETQLRMVLRSPRTEVEDIRAMLPGDLSRHAEAIAAILAKSGGEQPGSPAASESTGSEVRAFYHPDVDQPPPSGPQGVARPTNHPGAIIRGDSNEIAEAEAGSRADHANRLSVVERPDDVSGTDFARHVATELATPACSISVRSGQDGSRQLSWPAYVPTAGSGPTVVIYRMVSSDEDPPYSPDRARLVATSAVTSAADGVPHTAAVRYYQVWVNTGASRTEALAAQPHLHAHASVVGVPANLSIRDDSGQVVGSWVSPPGATAVWICRLPDGADARHDMQYRILAHTDNLAGFVDNTVSRGASYRYRVYTEATVAGQTLLSDPIETNVTVSAVLEPVIDMTVTNSGDGTVELSWSRPAGRVDIYRTAARPNDIVGAIAESALEQAGLSSDLRVTRPEAKGPNGRVAMHGVSWPDAWSRVYFTPVTILGGQALMGTPMSTVRVGAIGDIDLAEYCNLQVLTFQWPVGASSVEMQTAPRHYDPQEGLTGRGIDISKENYEKYGGHQLHGPNRLPPTGCSLHLAAVAHSGGRRVRGPWRSVDYPGMLRVKYRLMRFAGPNGNTSAAVVIQSELDVPSSPAFVLIHNRHRIPLAIDDGAAVDVTPYDAHARCNTGPLTKELRPTALTRDGGDERWIVELSALTGWLRLFFNSHDTRTMRGRALIDPRVDELYFDHLSIPRASR